MNIYYYLPNRPDYPGFKKNNLISKLKKNTVSKIIEKTGNHWRKIFSIMAKISWGLDQCEQVTWQDYRENVLFNSSKENIVFSNEIINKKNDVHLISGLKHFESFDLDIKKFRPISEDLKILRYENIYVVPYLDYRQFPNQLISDLIVNLKKEFI